MTVTPFEVFVWLVIIAALITIRMTRRFAAVYKSVLGRYCCKVENCTVTNFSHFWELQIDRRIREV